jgi:hypothetical protein
MPHRVAQPAALRNRRCQLSDHSEMDKTNPGTQERSRLVRTQRGLLVAVHVAGKGDDPDRFPYPGEKALADEIALAARLCTKVIKPRRARPEGRHRRRRARVCGFGERCLRRSDTPVPPSSGRDTIGRDRPDPNTRCPTSVTTSCSISSGARLSVKHFARPSFGPSAGKNPLDLPIASELATGVLPIDVAVRPRH